MKRGAILLLTMMTMALLGVASPARASATYTVNSTGDDGDVGPSDVCNTAPFPVGTEPECTLRAAIQTANAHAGADTIDFNIGGSGVKTISPATSLPIISEPVFIDGYSEPGASENTQASRDNAILLIRLDGANAAGIATGLTITTDTCLVRGLSITRFGYGIDIHGATADDNMIEGNFVGLTPTGKDRGNGFGLSIRDGASGNTVGGTTPKARNIISGNGPDTNLGGNGVGISENGTTGNKVMGNYIGTTKNGTGDLGNTGRGLIIGNGASGNIIGDGDPVDGLKNAANVIAFSGFVGVEVFFAGSTGNSILGNSIFSNAALGIDLGTDGVTPNDGVGDADTGPNNLQNFPKLSSANNGAKTTIKGTLRSTQNATFTIQFFRSPENTKLDGKKFIGNKVVTDLNGDGILPFTFKPQKKVKPGRFITATATNQATGDTSEFSAPKKVRS